MKRLVFGVLTEYMGILNDGKLVLGGIFDGFTMQVMSENMPVQLPPHWVVVRVGFPPSEVGEHRGALRLRDEDGREVFTTPEMPVQVNPGRVDGFEVAYNWGNNLPGLTVPRCGTYLWEVLVDGVMVGEVPFHVARAAQAPPQSIVRVG